MKPMRKIAVLFSAVLLLTGIFCMSAEADEYTDLFGEAEFEENYAAQDDDFTDSFGEEVSEENDAAQADDFIDLFGEAVFEGKDDWLFYSGDDTIADYEGTDTYTDEQLEAMCKRLTRFRDALEAHGCEFVIFIAPNKEQIYSQYMPETYGDLTDYTRAQQVTDYLKAAGLRVVYPADELKEAALEYPEYDFYYRRDTHWNELGSYIGARALMAELGIEMPSLDVLDIEPIAHDSEDLGKKIGRSLKDTGYELTGYIDERLDLFDNSHDPVFYTSKTGVDTRKVLIVGDSFSIALHRYIDQEFNEVVLCNDKMADIPELIEAVQPDIYIYEVVERYLDMLNSDFALTAPSSWTLSAKHPG